MSLVDNLPKKFQVNPWKGTTYDELYEVFCQNIRGGRLTYQGGTVWHFPNMEDGREEIFWHLTGRKDHTGERFPDHRRCERLPWVNPLLRACPNSEVLEWDYEEGDGTIKTYVWLKDEDFLVIMKKYTNGSRRLVTSFWIDQENTRVKTEKKYRNRL